MKVEPEDIDPAARRAASTNPADTKSKSLFAGRTFGKGAGNEIFKTKEVMSALDKQNPSGGPKAPQCKNRATFPLTKP
ncbi:MAG: hypothetical protein LBC11_02800 [Puniceicoccales bacterium]|jgi:hypothetical protein|nr:hypothetical protein [Puniceicoccales bacterium]